MTEPIAVDAPPKPVAGLPPRPVVAPVSVAPISATPKPDAAKPVAKPTVSASPPTPIRPPAGKPSFFQRLTRKQAAIGASALFSLAAGIAGVRLMSPGDEPEPPTASRPLVPDAPPAPKGPAIEEVKPEMIAPAGLPMPGTGAPAAPIPYPPGSPAASGPLGASGEPPPPEPLAPPAPGVPPKVVPLPGGDPIPPAAPPGTPPATGDMFTPIPKPPAKSGEIPEPDPLGSPPLIPIAGMQPAKSDPMKPEPPAVPSLPAVPALPGTPPLDPKGDPKAGPLADPMLDPPGAPPIKLPPLPGAVPPAKDKEPAKPVVGLPPVPGDPAGPMLPVAPPPAPGGTGNTGAMPPPIDLNPMPPAKLPTNPPAGGADAGTRMEFTKPSGSPTAATNDRAPTTSYDVDIYTPRTGDTWEAISREFYSDTRFAPGLRAYNRNRALAGNSPVDVPPIHIIKRVMAAAAPTPPGTGSGGFAPAADWGAATPPARPASDRLFRVPTGGMSMRAIARITLGSEQRFDEIYRLNPHLRPDEILPAGTELQLPPNARNP